MHMYLCSCCFLLFRTSMKFEPKWYLPLNELSFKCPEGGMLKLLVISVFNRRYESTVGSQSYVCMNPRDTGRTLNIPTSHNLLPFNCTFMAQAPLITKTFQRYGQFTYKLCNFKGFCNYELLLYLSRWPLPLSAFIKFHLFILS